MTILTRNLLCNCNSDLVGKTLLTPILKKAFLLKNSMTFLYTCLEYLLEFFNETEYNHYIMPVKNSACRSVSDFEAIANSFKNLYLAMQYLKGINSKM